MPRFPSFRSESIASSGPHRSPRSWRRSYFALAVSCCGLFVACGPGAEPPRNIVLISVDTLAAEHLSAYGYDKLTSPHLDDFASRASLYRNAYATAPWTLPTHASLFTGKYPFEHGARTFRQPATRSPLSKNHLTLAEALRDLGFRTAAFAANDAYLTEEFQLNQGFDT